VHCACVLLILTIGVACHPAGGVHQLETGVHGAVGERAARRAGPVADPSRRGAQA